LFKKSAAKVLQIFDIDRLLLSEVCLFYVYLTVFEVHFTLCAVAQHEPIRATARAEQPLHRKIKHGLYDIFVKTTPFYLKIFNWGQMPSIILIILSLQSLSENFHFKVDK